MYGIHKAANGLLCSSRPSLAVASAKLSPTRISLSRRTYADRKSEPKINYNPDTLLEGNAANPMHVNFRRVTANDLENTRQPPTEVKMLVRDFIEDSLYNPNYGYFPKQADIFSHPVGSFDFGNIKDANQFQEEVAQRYTVYNTPAGGPGRQVWHTPTELFQPFYGQAIARCLVSEYLLKYFPYEDFVIYEIGAGNGTLALNILDLLKEEHPEVYDRTRYHIIEISKNLVDLQRQKLAAHPCVQVTHQSAFRWDRREPAPCYFLAMEVIDNFAHDMVRYDLRTLEPYQGIVAIDANGDFSTHFTRVTDPLISSFFQLRRRLAHPPPIPRLLKLSRTMRNIYVNLPFAPNLSAPEYIPTRLLSLLQTLRTHFPRHRLLLSDFSSLPDTTPGVNAPVVQTRYQDTMVPCSTVFVKQGYFDIFFPTNFHQLRDMYEHILSEPTNTAGSQPDQRLSPLTSSATPISFGSDFFSSHRPSNRRAPVDGVTSASGLPVGERKSSVFSHREFLEAYADLSQTRLRNGENPLLDFYQNVKFLF